MGIDIAGSTADLTKHMLAEPRRVGKIEVFVKMKGTAIAKDQKILEKTGDTCPVMRSIHPDIELAVTYAWT